MQVAIKKKLVVNYKISLGWSGCSNIYLLHAVQSNCLGPNSRPSSSFESTRFEPIRAIEDKIDSDDADCHQSEKFRDVCGCATYSQMEHCNKIGNIKSNFKSEATVLPIFFTSLANIQGPKCP